MPPQRSSKKAGRVVRRTLADGTRAEYRYPPWTEPKTEGPYPADSLGGLIVAWKISPEWRRLAATTRSYYSIYLKELERLARRPAADITRRDILTLRDAIAASRGDGAADAFTKTAGAVFKWALDRERIQHSPVFRVALLSHGHLPAWTPEQAAAAIKHLPEDYRRVAVLALHTGQRRGDLCALTWTAYDGVTIRLTQQKTGAALVIPVTPMLRDELDAWKRTASAVTILTRRGLPWVPQHLSKLLPAALARIEGFPPGLNVHGLRKLAAANLAAAGCSTHEIAAITGHRTLAMVQLYTASVDQERLAQAAIGRLTTGKYKDRQTTRKVLK